ncbi:uncharacterized protein K452DRAFT_221924 [Aplosporella prunicola CBS 121167]|uniref:Ubiquitin carboxyl-terminal hydrolase n=1 Tax=Aplosporella prunicola CBS 121167 TaxID=1176127 RepID=A0A6A6BPG4_9PEZI|nr:uncharacterized protein K452DRAFT_221924 [Aplosporella prunicola CBS 121167]KAF2145165.1 hypothetical protein K452DRAFT_221924 [Aplosporella prunicola CBS 121167]
MPDKPLTIATYAAGASLAAITLVYVFGPTFLFDDDSASSATRKKGVVGLSNPANDCFINSVLQALAGLPYLRLYLIREIHRRNLDGADVYKVPDQGKSAEEFRKDIAAVKLNGLQLGTVTRALKEVLDNLNERPLYRKTISAQGFVGALEQAFHSRISRQQQDAQEFLQLVAERVCEEYHAGKNARRKARRRNVSLAGLNRSPDGPKHIENVSDPKASDQPDYDDDDDVSDAEEPQNEEGFPFEGEMESQIECLTCHFKPKPTKSNFVTLTLHVPQQSSTTLNSCFDGILKIEHIDDFKCEYCRLEHAVQLKQADLEKTKDENARLRLEHDILKLRTAMQQNPEKPPSDVELPSTSLAPQRRIARHMRISAFPKVLAIHLSRSVYTAGNYGHYSTKNMAKVAFPETLPLGGILDQKKYNLVGVVTHKGGHNSGHYESFRRQVIIPPFSTPHSFGTEGVYSIHGSPNPSAMTSAVQSPKPSIRGDQPDQSQDEIEHLPSPVYPPPRSASSGSSRSSRRQRTPVTPTVPTSTSRAEDAQSTTLRHRTSGEVKAAGSPIAEAVNKRRPHRKRDNRWWRISDDKVKESKTREVLGMQKEVYMLFYEIAREE